MSEGRWLRDKAAIIGFGPTAYGKRGHLSAARGTTPLVVEVVRRACEDAGCPSGWDSWERCLPVP